MRYPFLIWVPLFALTLTMCTPKTGDKTTSTPPATSAPATTQSEDFRKQVPAPGPAPEIQIGDYEEFELTNGLKVIVVENHKIPQVSFQIYVDAPQVVEGEEAGYRELAGSMLTRGTSTRSKAQIDQAVDFIGASMSSSASGIYGSCLVKHQETLLDLMQDALLNPTFSEEEFEKVKTQVISGLAASKDDPNTIAANVGQVLRYGKDHPYGSVATETSTNNTNLETCKKYYESFFKPNVSYLVVVGDIKPEKAKNLATQYFGKWEKASVLRTKFAKPTKPEEARVCFVDKPGAVQSAINITYPIDLQPGADDLIKARVLRTALGGYFRSRLNNNLREDKGYTYGARATINDDQLVGSFRAYAQVRNEVTDSSMVEFLKELKQLREEPMGEQELNLVKNYMTGIFAIQLEEPQTIARFALNIARYNLPKDFYKTYLSRLAEVSAEDVQMMAQKYLSPENAYLLVVGNKKEVAEKLTQFDADQEIEYFDAYGDPINMEVGAIPSGMDANSVLNTYFNSIGGKEKLETVTSMTQVMAAETQMGTLEISSKVKGSKFALTVKAGEMVLQQQLFNGEKGKQVAAGVAAPIPDEQLEALKEEAAPFPHLNYSKEGYSVNLEGVESMGTKKVYVLTVESPSGANKTEYYDQETGLLVKEIQVAEGPGEQSITVTREFSDYKEFDGVLFPGKIVTSGGMPFPITLEAKEIKLNPEIEDAAFE